jgi:hypothetical protein
VILTRPILLLVLTVCSCWGQAQLDTDLRLFSVLAAINAGGYDADLASPNNHPLRQRLRDEIAAKKLPVVAELKRFVAEHKRANPSADLSQYISFALSVKSAPEFEYRFAEDQLPPDVQALLGFERLIQRFHGEAGIADLYKKYEGVFEQVLQRYQGPSIQAINEVNAYMRNPSVGNLGRRFTVFVDLLGAPNQIHIRNYQDDFFVVVTPSAEPQVDYVRTAYFKFMVDPLALKFAEELNAKRGLIDDAQASPALDEIYKTDFLLLAGASLIKAIEARLAPVARREAMVNQALREGYVVAPAFYDLLPAYEKQEQSLRLYFPDLINGINLRREEKRLEAIDFVKEKPARKARVVDAPPPAKEPELTGFAKVIDDADRLIEQRQLDPARKMLLAAMDDPQFADAKERKWKGRVYFGLARIAVLQKDPEKGFELFNTALELTTEGAIQAWCRYYLGRLHELAQEPEDAARQLRAAADTVGASLQTKRLAEQALAELEKRKRQ